MLVFWDQKLVLLSVPKTGTTALEGALSPHADIVIRNPPPLKHAPVYRYRRFLKPLFIQGGGANEAELQTVAAVRHPIDWLSSWYRYRHRDDLTGHANSTKGRSFDDFVTEYMKGKPADFANVGAQSKFVLDGDGNLGVDHLFRYETGELEGWMEDSLGVAITLNQRNVSPKMDISLSPDIEAKFRKKCASEFEVWEMGRS